MITNPKIERKKADIARTENKLVAVQARLRQQKEELVKLEDEEIVAKFRNERMNEDDYAVLLHPRRATSENADAPDERVDASDTNSNSSITQKGGTSECD